MLSCGCDRIYGVLHKPGGEEREIIGEFTFNEYNARVEQIQSVLKMLGYSIGRADGKFGASTRDNVARFQEDEDLEVTRFVDKKTWARLEFYRQSPFFHKGQLSGLAVQKALKAAGYNPGKIDGHTGAMTRAAVKRFQAAQGLKPDGYAGIRTIRALIPYLEGAGESAAPVAGE